MTLFNYKNTGVFQGHRLIGFLVILAGIFGLLSPQIFEVSVSLTRILVVGGGAIAFGLMMATAYEGTQIDLSQKQVKYYTSFMGVKFGRWDDLPAISAIKLVTKTSHVTNPANGVSPTLSGDVTDHTVFAYALDAGIPHFSFSYQKEEEAVKTAELLARSFEIELEQ